MALLNPVWLGKKNYASKEDRRLIEAIYGLIEQVLKSDHMLLTATGGANTAVAAGQSIVDGDTNADQGMYLCTNDASVTLIHTPDGTNPRVNRVVLQVNDSEAVGSGADSCSFVIVPGTPNVAADINNPATYAPAVPASAMPIARVLVPTSGVIATVVDERPRTKGRVVIPTDQTYNDVTYAVLGTPDVIPNIVLPADGLIMVGYQAQWMSTVLNDARAGIFLNNVQLSTYADGAAAPAIQVAGLIAAANAWRPLATFAGGLYTPQAAGTTSYTGGDVTTGQVIGAGGNGGVGGNDPGSYGHCAIFAAAGTYDVGVRFRQVTSGIVHAKNRKLWVWTLPF